MLGQLGLKIQHALRAFTPKDRRAVKLIAESFRTNPKLDTEQVITELSTGEALVSALQKKGEPSPVERTLIRPPTSQIGPITKALRNQITASGDVTERYRESAYEKLKTRAELKQAGKAEDKATSATAKKSKRSSNRQSIGEAMAKSVARAIGSNIGRQLVRGIMGSLFGKR